MEQDPYSPDNVSEFFDDNFKARFLTCGGEKKTTKKGSKEPDLYEQIFTVKLKLCQPCIQFLFKHQPQELPICSGNYRIVQYYLCNNCISRNNILRIK